MRKPLVVFRAPCKTHNLSERAKGMDIVFPTEGAGSLSGSESRLFRELVEAIRDIRFGSVLLVIHDNRLVEIQKTKKVRVAGSRDDN